jgi:hypothetical protein
LGTTGYVQNPSGASISEAAQPLLVLLNSDGSLAQNLGYIAGARHNQLTTIASLNGRWLLGGMINGPGTHSGDADRKLIVADGFLREGCAGCGGSIPITSSWTSTPSFPASEVSSAEAKNEGNNVIKSHLKHILEKRTANGNSCPRKTSSSLVNELKSARGRMARSCPHIQGALLHDACFPHNIPDKIT